MPVNSYLPFFFLAQTHVSDSCLNFNSPNYSQFCIGDAKQIFAEIRGQWRPVAGYQDLMKTVQRFYCNAFSDFERQDAINV